MVKIINEYGDKYTGKLSNAIYQKVHGQQVRRKAYKQTKDPSPRQLEVRNKFKDAIAWIKTFTYDERAGIKNYYKNSKLGYDPSYPVNWYNFAKWIYIKNPVFNLKDPIVNEYSIRHPAITLIQEYTADGTLLFQSNVLSSLTDGLFTNSFVKTASEFASTIIITLLSGFQYTYSVTPPTTELRFFDIRFFDPRFFE